MPVDSHVTIRSPLKGTVIAPSTVVVVALKVSEQAAAWLEGGPGGCCLVVERGEDAPIQECVDGVNTFTLTPTLLGPYLIRAFVWVPRARADGVEEVVAHEAKPVMVRVGEDAPLDPEAFRRQEGFRMIYDYGHWGEEGGRSGDGSSLDASRSDRGFLLAALQRYEVASLFDAGCGSLTWQPTLLADYEQAQERAGRPQRRLRYHGADIVPEVVKANARRFEGEPSMSFSQLDIAREPSFATSNGALDGSSYDAILCRHALFHNTIDSIERILAAVRTSGAKFFIATTLRPIDDSRPPPPSGVVNADLRIGTDGRLMSLGGYRPVDLESPPFNLEPPLLWSPGEARSHARAHPHHPHQPPHHRRQSSMRRASRFKRRAGSGVSHYGGCPSCSMRRTGYTVTYRPSGVLARGAHACAKPPGLRRPSPSLSLPALRASTPSCLYYTSHPRRGPSRSHTHVRARRSQTPRRIHSRI